MDVLSIFISGPLPLINRLAVLPINFIAAALVLAVVNHDKLKKTRSKIFVTLAMLILVWVDFAYLARRVGPVSLEMSEIFLRIAWVATPFVFFFSYMLSLLLGGQIEKHKRLTITLLVITLAMSALTAFTNIIIEGQVLSGANLDIVFGKGFLPFMAAIMAIMVMTLVPIIKAKLDSGRVSFLIGLIIFYVANMIFNIGLPVFGGVTHLYYFGDYSTIFLLIFTSYAVIRHKLFDIKVFATEILVVAIWSILLVKLLVSQTIFDTVLDGVVLIAMVVLGIVLIRSVRREIEQKEMLERLTDRLKEVDMKKDEFLNVAAHELRAPMTAIKGYISMVQSGDGGEIPDKAKDFLSEAYDENDRLVRLVNNMLNVARIEEKRMVYEMGTVNLADVVEKVFNEYKHGAEQKKLVYGLSIEKGVLDHVEVDVDRIYEVVSNLISNAVKYTDKGQVTVGLANIGKNKVRFEVVDTGLGLDQEEQKHLFEKFYRAESNIGKKIGTGLGLYVSRLLVEKFKGEIGFTSRKGKGSTFWFELPLET
ncbi:hypothetical protein C4564_00970 [Candidatus Microgenomates bacterium]|nr:MAG: hypothetical protein C4564_00970 [Candidatus Microgenomates bacterium]